MFVACISCRVALQVSGDPEEIKSLLGDKTSSYPCAMPLCDGRMTQVPMNRIPGIFARRDMPVRGFFRAVNGFGSGEGPDASLENVAELMKTKVVADVIGETVGQPPRSIIKQIVYEDGTRLHLETSALGACAYFIEEAGNSCLETVDAAPANRTAEVPESDREETRRATENGSAQSLTRRQHERPRPNEDGQSESGGVPPVSGASDVRGDAPK